MKSSYSASANRYSNFLRTPEDKSMRRVASNDRIIGRSIPSTQPADLPPADINARYSISYLPGVNERM